MYCKTYVSYKTLALGKENIKINTIFKRYANKNGKLRPKATKITPIKI